MSRMIYADVELPKPEVHAMHPFLNRNSHEKLLDYLKQRLVDGKNVRDNEIDRLVRIDKHVAGWMRMSEEDRKRVIKEEEEGTPQAVTVNLPLTFIHLDDMMTYFLETFAPNRGMFYSVGKPSETDSGDQITAIFNNNAIYTGYFQQAARGLYNILKYNDGGFMCNWSIDQGPKLTEGENGKTTLTQEDIWQGNRAVALDNYNTFWDPSVERSKCYCEGEFAARAMLLSRHNLAKKAAQGLYYNCEEALQRGEEGVAVCTYYRHPPAEANMDIDDSKGKTNWVSVLSMTSGYARKTGYELVETYIWVNPYQLNLIPRSKQNKATRNKLELWRITLLNDMYIVDTTMMNNMHGYIPFFAGVLNDDLMGRSAKSTAETIHPLANFASFLMNTHIAATRKNIWGLTVYDSSVVDLAQIPKGEVAARVGTKSSAAGKKVSDAIYEHQGTLDTKQTMGDLEAVFGIINQFYPTQSLPGQIASIDRAVDRQVAAVQQGANRRMHKGAKLLDDILFRPLRFCMYYNVVQYQNDGVEISNYYGEVKKIDLSKLRQTDLPFIIGQGLKMLDRQMIAQELQKIIFALIQNPAAAARFDLPRLINHWADMVDMDIDLSQFQLQMTIDPATGQPVAQQGAQPITNPLAVTGPLTKPGVESAAAIGDAGA